MGYIVSLVVIVNLKVSWRSFTSNLEFLHYSSVLPQSASSIKYVYMSKVLCCYLLFHSAVFKKSPILLY